jgi:hypothetical protein
MSDQQFYRRVKELLAELQERINQFSTTGIVPSSNSQWKPVTNANTPFTAGAGQLKFAVDSSAGGVAITLATALPNGTVVWVNSVGNMTNPITLTPTFLVAGNAVTIQDPATATFRANATITAFGPAAWQLDTTSVPGSPRFIQIV